MFSETAIQANRSTPCPLCDGDRYCYLIQDDLGEIVKAICHRTDAPPDGWDRVGQAKDGRSIFARQGYRRNKRKNFPDFIKLSPTAPASDIPQWQDSLPTDRAIAAGDLVVWRGILHQVQSTKGGSFQGRWLIAATIARYPNGLGTAEVPDSELALATADPETGAKERFIEYLYSSPDGQRGKVVRHQWTDRRCVYEKFRKSKQIRPYHWAGGEGSWSQGKGDRPWPLYREVEAKDEILRGGILFAVAGEQAVEVYRELGLVATTCQGGEANFKQIVDRLKDAFYRAKQDGQRPFLAIHPDNDITGDAKFSELLRECEAAKISAVELEPLDLWKEMPIGGDIYNLVHESGMDSVGVLRQLEVAIDLAIDRQEQEVESRKQRDRWQAPEAYRGELGYWKEDKESGARYFRPQADFDFQVERELISEDGGGLVLQVKRTDDAGQRRVYLKSADYNSVQSFVGALKKSLGGGVICNLSNYALQSLLRVRLHEYRVTRKGKAYRLIDRVGQQRDGSWVFKRVQFTRSGELTTEEKSLWIWNPEVTGDDTYFQPPEIAPQDPHALQALVAAMSRAFGSNFAPALLTLGYAAAGVHYQEIQEAEGAFPILNLYGDPGSGKTTAAECALSLIGQHKEGMMVEISVSAAYERLKLAGGLLHCLDDPKRDESLDEFLKGFYNAKARVVRGGDAAKFNTQRPHSPLMVTSNHACGENSAATQSRLVRLFFPKAQDGDSSAFRELPALQKAASGCFTRLVALGYPSQEVHQLESELAAQIPNAHLRIAKSLALLLCYSMKVAELAGIDPGFLKRYVLEVVCAQVNDPDESGDSLRDFLEKVFALQSESKIGEWNCRWVDKEAGRVLAIYIPGVWGALDRAYAVSYNRKIIESLLASRGVEKTRQHFHSDEDQSRAYYRAKLTASNIETNSPERVLRWCYELPEELLREYSEKNTRPGRSPQIPPQPDQQEEVVDLLLISGDQQPKALSEESFGSKKEAVDPVDQQKPPPSRPPKPGDVVVVKGVATWLQKGSDLLPWKAVPPSRRDSLEIPITLLSDEMFHELTQPSEVLSVSVDGQRVRIRGQKSGRVSVFNFGDIELLKPKEELCKQ